MNKNHFLLIPVLITGLFLGHLGNNLWLSKSGNSRSEDATGVPPAALLMENRINKTDKQNTPNTLNEPDREIQRYSRMNQEELWSELDSISKKSLGFRDHLSPLEENILIPYIFSRLSRESPRQTMEKINNLGYVPNELILSFMRAWATKNPEGVQSYCREQWESTGEKNYVPSQVYLSLLAKSSPREAVDFLSSFSSSGCSLFLQPPFTQKESPLFQMNEEMPAVLLKSADKLKLDLLKEDDIRNNLIASWAKSDWDAAAQWINRIKP